MKRFFARSSFTTRLLLLAGVVMGMLVLIDYIALLEAPRRIARDTVEIALRENVAALSNAFREDRVALQEQIDGFMDQTAVGEAVLNKDAVTLDTLVQSSIGPDIRFQFIRANAINTSGAGVITAAVTASRPGEASQPVVFYRPVDDELLNRAEQTAGGDVSFAVEKDNEFIARGDAFPRSLRADQLDAPIEPLAAELSEVRVDGRDLHVYSRSLTPDVSFKLHALSSPTLEEESLAVIRQDVRLAIFGMTLATITAFLLLVFFTNRTVRSFARRVRTLADGDYGTRMTVRGKDGFADLANSVNRLSVQLEDQLSQLGDTAAAFGRTLETLEEGICVWNDDGTITFWNRGAEQLTGLARERVGLAEPIISFLHAERTPGTRRVTLPVRRSGTGLVVDLVVTAMPGGGVVQTFRDTTMADILQQTQRNFMATAAHELRTPITTILGFADTLTNPELELTERQQQEFLSIIREQSHHLQEIADAFFTNHQLANERVEVSIAPTPLHLVVADALERVAISLPDRAAEIEQITHDIAPTARALADRRALVGVVAVFIENALKYGSAPISISTEQNGGAITLLVRDEGPGIDPYHQVRVFDPFYRIDVDMRSGIGGAGLGLFTARKLVEAMHGIVRLRSSPGKGSTFIVELPAASSETDDGPGEQTGRSLRLIG